MVCLWLFSVLRDILTWSRAVLRDNEDADYGSAFSFEPDTHNLKEVRGECMSLKSARGCQLSGREPHSPRQRDTDGAVAGGRANDAERLGVKLMEAARSVMLMQKYYFFLYIQSLYIRFFVTMQSVALPLWSLNPARRRHGDDWKQKKGVVFLHERSDSRNATGTQLSLGCALVYSPWHSTSKPGLCSSGLTKTLAAPSFPRHGIAQASLVSAHLA